MPITALSEFETVGQVGHYEPEQVVHKPVQPPTHMSNYWLLRNYQTNLALFYAEEKQLSTKRRVGIQREISRIECYLIENFGLIHSKLQKYAKIFP